MSSQPVAIATGGASGIGLACTKNLLARGYKVCIANANAKAGQAVAEELGADVLFIQTDVSDYEQQQKLFAGAFAWSGQRLDFLAVNAGIDDRQSLYEANETIPIRTVSVMGDEKMNIEVPEALNLKTIRIDLDAVLQGVWLFKYFNRISKKGPDGRKGGQVVVTSSSARIYRIETNPQYGTAKHGLIGLVRSAGPILHQRDNITLNAICPAFVITNLCPPFIRDTFPKEHITPMSTIMKAYDVFLDDDDMTAQTVECSLDQLYFRQMPEWSNASQKWMGEGSDGFWERAYEEVAPARNGI